MATDPRVVKFVRHIALFVGVVELSPAYFTGYCAYRLVVHLADSIAYRRSRPTTERVC
jgi:hypothetical protein